MKTGMILALVSGILALLIGVLLTLVAVVVGGSAGAFGASGLAAKSALVAVLLLGLPIMVIIGGALAHSSPKAATVLTGLPGLVIVLLGLQDPEKAWFLLVLGVMMVAAAYLIYSGSKSAPVGGASEV
jgi:hypothetical protein